MLPPSLRTQGQAMYLGAGMHWRRPRCSGGRRSRRRIATRSPPPLLAQRRRGSMTSSSQFINYIVIQLEIFISIHQRRIRLHRVRHLYDELITLHQLHSDSIGDIHQYSSASYPSLSSALPLGRRGRHDQSAMMTDSLIITSGRRGRRSRP